MPQVVAIAVAAFQAAATVATTVGAAMGFSGIAATVAGAASIISSTTQMWSAISSAVGAKPKVSASTTQLQTKVGAVTPRSIIMGRTAVAGTLLTPTPLQSGRGNALATNFYALSHVGPSGVVESVQWGEDTVTFDGSGQAIGKYANNMWLFQKNGSWSQTAITFTGTPGIGSDTPAAWDSTKKAQGCLVVALVVRYAASVLANNMQTPLFVVDANAVALTDPRTGLAATTQAQRRNPAVWAYSWRLGWFQNSKRVIGMGQASSEVHAAGYAYAANVADANGWTIGGEATTADDRYAVESAILQACASVPVERNGLQSVVTSATRASVGTITSDDLRAGPKWRYATQQTSRPTAIQTRYRSETNRWQVVEGVEVTDASWLTQDAGREKRVTVEYPYAAGGSAHVGHLAALDASNAREPLVFTLQCKQQARYAGFVGDAVTISLPEIGLSSTKMIVMSRVVNPDGTVDYELLVETDAKYAFAAGKTSAAPSFTLNPGFDIFNVPQPDLADWTAVAAQITSGGTTSLPIVRVTGSASNYDFASGVVFKLRLNSGGSPWVVSEDAPPAATQHEFRGLTNATSYIVGIAYRGVTGVEGPVRELAAVTTGVLVSNEAATVPWDGVSGTGKPDDNATVGGTIGTDIRFPDTTIAPIGRVDNAYVPAYGANLVRYSRVLDTSKHVLGFNNTGFSAPLTYGVSGDEGYVYRQAVGTVAGASSLAILHSYALNRFVVAGLSRVEASVEVYMTTNNAIASKAWGIIYFYDSAGTQVGSSFFDSTTLQGGWIKVEEFVTVPGTAKFAIMAAQIDAGAGSINPFVGMRRAFCGAARADQTAFSPYVVGSESDQGADVTGDKVAGGYLGQGNQSGKNTYRQSTAPSSPAQWDEWQDTSVSPVLIKVRLSGVWVTIAEEGSDITAQAVPSVEGPKSISFDVDAGGALSPGSQVPRTLQFIRKRGNTDVSTSTTWTIVSPVNITLGTITNGGVNVTAIAAGLSNFTVRSVRDGVTIDYLVEVNKNTIAAGVTPPDIVKGDIVDDNTLGYVSSTSWTDVLSANLPNCPGGYFETSGFYSPASATGNVTVEVRLTVNGTQVGSVFSGKVFATGGVVNLDDLSDVLGQFLAIGSGNKTVALQFRAPSTTGSINTGNGQFVVNVIPTT